MNFSIGDKVAVIDDVIKGEVIKVSPDSVSIEDENGFVLEFEPSQLVKIKVEQKELSKYSDINNLFLKEKTNYKETKRKVTARKRERNVHPTMEVDLHIQHLVKSTKGMTNYDILTLQVETAKRQLEFAIRKRIPKIIFIHGIGEGVLQKELEFLLKKYNVNYYDAPYHKYGLGATEVYIYQNKNR